MLDALLSAGTSILGGLLNKSSSDKANEINQANVLRQEALQREFAQSGIQWKVEDAKKAGVHPLYALGAQTTSYSPTTVGAVGDTSLGSGIASAGQDLSRAIATTSSKPTRLEAVAAAQAVEKGSLENELLKVQIAKLKGQIGPPMPTLADRNAIPGQPVTVPEAAKPDDRPQLALDGGKVLTHPGFSNADEYEKRWGELSDYTAGPWIMLNDLGYNINKWWFGPDRSKWGPKRGNTGDYFSHYRHGASARGRDEAFRRSRAGRW